MGGGQSSSAKRGSTKSEPESNRKFDSYHLPFTKKKKQSKLSKHLSAATTKSVVDVRKNRPLLPLPPDIYHPTRFQKQPSTPETHLRNTRPLPDRRIDDTDLYSNLTVTRTVSRNNDLPQNTGSPFLKVDHNKYSYNLSESDTGNGSSIVRDIYASVTPSTPSLLHRSSHDSSSEDKSFNSDTNRVKPNSTSEQQNPSIDSAVKLTPKLHRSSCDSSSEDKSSTSVFEDASDDLVIICNVSLGPNEAPLTEENGNVDDDFDNKNSRDVPNQTTEATRDVSLNGGVGQLSISSGQVNNDLFVSEAGGTSAIKMPPTTMPKNFTVRGLRPKKHLVRPKVKTSLRPNKKAAPKTQQSQADKKAQVSESKTAPVPKKISVEDIAKRSVTFGPNQTTVEGKSESPKSAVNCSAAGELKQPSIQLEEQPQVFESKSEKLIFTKTKVKSLSKDHFPPQSSKENTDIKETKDAINIKLSKDNLIFKPTNMEGNQLIKQINNGSIPNSSSVAKSKLIQSPDETVLLSSTKSGHTENGKSKNILSALSSTPLPEYINTITALDKADAASASFRDISPERNKSKIQQNPKTDYLTTVALKSPHISTHPNLPKPQNKLNDNTPVINDSSTENLHHNKIQPKHKDAPTIQFQTHNNFHQDMPKHSHTFGPATSIKNDIVEDSTSSPNRNEQSPKLDSITAATLKMPANTHHSLIRTSDTFDAAMALSELNQKYSKVAEDLCNLLANSCHEDFLISLEELVDSAVSEPQTEKPVQTPTSNSIEQLLNDTSKTYKDYSTSVVLTPSTQTAASVKPVEANTEKKLVAVMPISHTVATIPSGHSVVSTPSGHSVVSPPSEHSVVSIPSGQSVASTPSGHSVVPIPGGHSVLSIPSSGKESNSLTGSPTPKAESNSPKLSPYKEHLNDTTACDVSQLIEPEDSLARGFDNMNYSGVSRKDIVPIASGKRSDSSSLSSDNDNLILVNDSSSNGTSTSDMTDDVWEDDETSNKDFVSANEIKTKLVEDLIKSSEVNLGDFQQFLEISTSVSKKYHYLPIDELIRRNLEIGVDIDGLGRCLRVLAKYGLDLMKPEAERQDYSKKIVIGDNLFQTDFQQMPGIAEILKCFGYEEQEDGFVFAGSSDDDPISLAVWVIEMLLAAHELNYYNLGLHPQPHLLDVYFKSSPCLSDAHG